MLLPRLKVILLVYIFLAFYISSNAQNCYREYIQTINPEHKAKFIGIFNGQRFFSDIMSFNNGSNTDVNAVLLRTDSIIINDFDFCFDLPDTVQLINLTDSSEQPRSYTLNDIPTIYQLLVYSIHFATLDGENTEMYFKKNFLYLKFTEGSCISNCPYYDVTEKYKFEGKTFKLISRRTKKLKD